MHFKGFVFSNKVFEFKDEEQFIKKELSLQRQRLAQPNLSPVSVKYMCSCQNIYVRNYIKKY